MKCSRVALQRIERELKHAGLSVGLQQKCWSTFKLQDLTLEAAMSCPCPGAIDYFRTGLAANLGRRGENQCNLL